jgi:hypothetical protein
VDTKPLAVVFDPILVERFPLAVVFDPILVDRSPLAVVERPILVDTKPLAVVFDPILVDASPMAVVELPILVEKAPFALLLKPLAKEKKPILSLSQDKLLTCPTLKAAFSGYHIRREPAPETGGPNNVEFGTVARPVNTTPLSATCSRALGVVVPIPTLPVWAEVDCENTDARAREIAGRNKRSCMMY